MQYFIFKCVLKYLLQSLLADKHKKALTIIVFFLITSFCSTCKLSPQLFFYHLFMKEIQTHVSIKHNIHVYIYINR